jgi:hypothetical protein
LFLYFVILMDIQRFPRINSNAGWVANMQNKS